MRNAASKIAALWRKAGLAVFLLWTVPAIAIAQPMMLEVVQADAGTDARTNKPVLTFRLTTASARSYAEFTSKNVGRAMEVRVDGRVLVKTVIREPILGGSSQIAGDFTAADARDLADRIAGGGNRIEVELVAD